MARSPAFFPIVLALGTTILAPLAIARGDGREEGLTEINQCQTISQPGSYKLVKNLTGPVNGNANCLVITTSFVTIDLAGFTMTGGNGSGTAILAVPPSSGSLVGIAVRNGSISVFLNGVDLSSATGSIVEGLRVVGNFSGQPVEPVTGFGTGINADGIVKGNTASFYTNGIIATGLVVDNLAEHNTQGLEVGADSTVIGNTVTSSARGGIAVSCPSNVTNNTAVNIFAITNANLTFSGDGCSNTNNVAPGD